MTERQKYVLGTIPAGARTMTHPKESGIIRLRAIPSASVKPLAEIMTTVTRGPEKWTWPVSARFLAAGISLSVSTGDYVVSLGGPAYRQLSLGKVSVAHAKTADLGTVELQPRLQITGTVHLRPGGLAIGAEIAADGFDPVYTDANGAFAITASDRLPRSIVVSAPGYARVALPIPDVNSTADLGKIVLEPGVSVQIATRFADGEKRPATLTLTRRGSTDAAAAVRQSLDESGTATFRNIASGKYVLRVDGPEPLMKYATILDVGETDVQHDVEIEPVTLVGHVYYGSDPLENVDVTVAPRGALWQAELRTRGEGEFGGELWSSGPLLGVVEGAPLQSRYLDEHTAPHNGRERDWDIIVPQRSIRGKVLDADTREPVVDAIVAVEIRTAITQTSLPLHTDVNGAFEVTAVPTGTVKMSVRTRDHIDPEPLELKFADGDASRDVTFVAQRGFEWTLRLEDEDGRPVRGATVVDGVDANGMLWKRRVESDALGLVRLRALAQERRQLFVIPPGGSFAVLDTVTPPRREDEPTRIKVPVRTGALTIEVADGDRPLPNVSFVVRYNGVLLPQAFWSLLQSVQGMRLATDGQGLTRLPRVAPGTYELWPYGNDAEGRALYRTTDGRPAATVGVAVADDQRVKLTFERTGKSR